MRISFRCIVLAAALLFPACGSSDSSDSDSGNENGSQAIAWRCDSGGICGCFSPENSYYDNVGSTTASERVVSSCSEAGEYSCCKHIGPTWCQCENSDECEDTVASSVVTTCPAPPDEYRELFPNE